MNPNLTHAEITHAAHLLREGRLVAFPTETVYGLGGDATNDSAVRRIFEVKGRPSSNPLIVHVASFEDILRYSDTSRSKHSDLILTRLRALEPLWPGPLSVVLPKNASISPLVCAGGDSVALRIPRHPIALALLKTCNLPLAAPSANPSTYISPTTAQHVRDGLGDQVSHIIDGGPCTIGLESTVLSLIDETPRILRPGAVTALILRERLGCDVIDFTRDKHSPDTPSLSPGLMEKHYAPRTRIVLRPELSGIGPLPSRVGVVLFADHPSPCEALVTITLSERGDLEKIGAKLFAALRELDQMGLDLIIVDTCESAGFGIAIMDRLTRASAR